MKRIFQNKLSNLKEGEIIHGFFYCNDKIIKYSKNGDLYLDVLLTDDTSSLYAKVWSHADYFNTKFTSDSSVAVKGKVVKYRDRFELNILNINIAQVELYGQEGFKG